MQIYIKKQHILSMFDNYGLRLTLPPLTNNATQCSWGAKIKVVKEALHGK
jgi:hypothetical protein